MSKYPYVYFDTDELSENLGWVLRLNDTYSYDGFKTESEALEFLEKNKKILNQLFINEGLNHE